MEINNFKNNTNEETLEPKEIEIKGIKSKSKIVRIMIIVLGIIFIIAAILCFIFIK